MKPKQLALVVVLALVLGGLGYVITRRNQAAYLTSGSGQGQKVLPEFPLNDVARVTVRSGTNEVVLAKEGDNWKVRERGGYPANFTEVGGLLRKIWELKAVQAEEIGPSQLGRLQLQEGAGTNTPTRVECYDAGGKSIAVLVLGKQHLRKAGDTSPMGGMDGGWPDGRWVQNPAQPGLALLVSEPFTEVEPKAERWLNKDFFKVEKLKSVQVTHPEATNSWNVYRETEGGELKLADLKAEEKLDTGKASSVGSALSWPSFVDVAGAEATPAETGLAHPVVARLETFDGFVYTIQAGAKEGAGENYALKVAVSAELPKERAPGADEKAEDKERLDKEFKEKLSKLEEKLKTEKAFEPWVFIVSKWTIDPILKKRQELLQDKKDESATPAAAAAPAPPLEDAADAAQ